MNFVPQDKPGFTLLHAQISERLYVVQKKDGIGAVRLFIRRNDNEALRTIFVGVNLKECMDYADVYEGSFGG